MAEHAAARRPEPPRLLELFRPVAPVVLTAFSGVVVWSLHALPWPWFLAYLLVGFVAGSVFGGLVGVPLVSSWSVMGMAGGLFEGVYRGWLYGGGPGAVVGPMVGVVAGTLVAGLLSAALSFALVLCGIDPFVNAETGEGNPRS